jgi:hypothetical protein
LAPFVLLHVSRQADPLKAEAVAAPCERIRQQQRQQ